MKDGGARVSAAGETLATAEALQSEYAGLYRRFAELIDRRASDVDVAPLRLVADAFLTGKRNITDPFDD